MTEKSFSYSHTLMPRRSRLFEKSPENRHSLVFAMVGMRDDCEVMRTNDTKSLDAMPFLVRHFFMPAASNCDFMNKTVRTAPVEVHFFNKKERFDRLSPNGRESI